MQTVTLNTCGSCPARAQCTLYQAGNVQDGSQACEPMQRYTRTLEARIAARMAPGTKPGPWNVRPKFGPVRILPVLALVVLALGSGCGTDTIRETVYVPRDSGTCTCPDAGSCPDVQCSSEDGGTTDAGDQELTKEDLFIGLMTEYDRESYSICSDYPGGNRCFLFSTSDIYPGLKIGQTSQDMYICDHNIEVACREYVTPKAPDWINLYFGVGSIHASLTTELGVPSPNPSQYLVVVTMQGFVNRMDHIPDDDYHWIGASGCEIYKWDPNVLCAK